MFFQLGYIPAPASPFLDVRKIEPGHTLTWRGGDDVRIRQYWDLPSETATDAADIEEQVRQTVAAKLPITIELACLALLVAIGLLQLESLQYWNVVVPVSSVSGSPNDAESVGVVLFVRNPSAGEASAGLG